MHERMYKMTKVFIDGSAGTTGLRIYDRLSARADIELIILDDAVRKDINARRDAINRADVAFLCLPDATSDAATSIPYKKPQHAAWKSKAKAFFKPNLSHKIEAVDGK